LTISVQRFEILLFLPQTKINIIQLNSFLSNNYRFATEEEEK
jgi:hypothetical protein